MPADLSFDRVIEFARDLIRIPSPPGGEGDVARRVLEEFRALGYDEAWIDGLGNVIGRIRGAGAAPPIMLACHLDVVDVGDPGAWEYPPFEGVVEGGFLHGRGAMDIKGPLAVQTYAAAHFLEDRPPGDLLVCHTVFEERGGWGMLHLLEDEAIRPGLVVIGEATAGDICIGHRGRAEIVVEIRGAAAHASAPERARSPLDVLGDVLTALRDFADALPADAVLGRSTLAPTRVETLPRSNNVIPERALVTVDWRVLPGMTETRAVAALQAFLDDAVFLPDGREIVVRTAVESQRSYTGIEAERPLFRPGFLVPSDHPAVRAAAAAIERRTGSAPRVRPWTFATDGAHVAARLGIPALGFAPGDERFAHTNRERLDLDQARAVYEACPDVLRALFDALGEVP